MASRNSGRLERACLIVLALISILAIPSESQYVNSMGGGSGQRGSTPTPTGSLNSLFGHPDPPPQFPAATGGSGSTQLRGGNRVDIQKIMDVPDKEKPDVRTPKAVPSAAKNPYVGTNMSKSLLSLTGKDKVAKPVNPLEELSKTLTSEHGNLPKAHAQDEPVNEEDLGGGSGKGKSSGNGDPAWNFLKKEIQKEENGAPKTPSLPSIFGGGSGRSQLQSNVNPPPQANNNPPPQANSAPPPQANNNPPPQANNNPPPQANSAQPPQTNSARKSAEIYQTVESSSNSKSSRPENKGSESGDSPSMSPRPPNLTDRAGIEREFRNLARG